MLHKCATGLRTWGLLILGAQLTLAGSTSHDAYKQIPILTNDNDLYDARHNDTPSTLRDVLYALETMQSTYFDTFAGTWGDAIDWTAAVTGTHLSATLSTIVDSLSSNVLSPTPSCEAALSWSNLVNKYYMQSSFFYFGENAFGLRQQAFDDMLWVVLGWLESIKFMELYVSKHWDFGGLTSDEWHGVQMKPMAAHRARIFYELASAGWDTQLCDGGMVWNPSLEPYKNAITNELYAAASISMYLYFPGDNNTSPFMQSGSEPPCGAPHDPIFLENAIKTYKWLKDSGMQNRQGLYQDGFHITGWKRYPNGTINPGSGRCDDLDTMVYTYNQGVLLTASRGLWLATGARSYLEDGHDLISNVIRATGWPNKSKKWRGLGRAGVLEEFCDHGLYCSQNGQTFKGIFFHHLSEFCRPLRPQEEEWMAAFIAQGMDEEAYKYHMSRCAAYLRWVEHNADAALVTRNDDGLFGMWWGVRKSHEQSQGIEQELPAGAVDHINPIVLGQQNLEADDVNDRGRGRTVETQGTALAVLRAKWMWQSFHA